MSVFKGSILEYPGVVVDRFNPINCRRGRAFFLSHCHKGTVIIIIIIIIQSLDHMSGLDSDELLKVLKELKIDFYCSEVTHALLSNDPGFSHLMPYLVSGCYDNNRGTTFFLYVQVSVPVGETISLKLNTFRNEDQVHILLVINGY